MKNNRSTNIDADLQAQHQLSTNSPPANSLFWKLWNTCIGTANQALNTDFVQGIKAGTLDPVVYGGFNVSDAYYCFKGAGDYLTAASKATDPTLKAFLLKKHSSYETYNNTFPKTWHVKDATSIVPSSVCQEYSAFETQVVANEDPIYALIVMLPCEYLWAWLGAELSPANKGNLYASWITGNNYPQGAYAMGNFLVDYQKQYPIDENKAQEIYAQAMEFEFQNFAIATAR